jgi:hypothetical protein
VTPGGERAGQRARHVAETADLDERGSLGGEKEDVQASNYPVPLEM